MTGHPPQRPSRWLSYSGLGSLCLVVSVGAHVALLGISLPDLRQEVNAPIPETDPLTDVAVTVIPKVEPQPQLDSAALVPPAPEATSPVTPAAPQPATVPSLAPSPPSTQPDPAPETPAPAVESPVVKPFTPPPPLEPDAPAAFADFPHLEGAMVACPETGNCWQSPVSSWRSATTNLRNRLEAQGYTVDNITGEVLSTETGVRVYAVTKAGEDTYYLNLVSISTGILYSMTPEPITMEQVEALWGS